MEMSEMLEIKRIENFNALFITNALESEVQDFLLQYPVPCKFTHLIFM